MNCWPGLGLWWTAISRASQAPQPGRCLRVTVQRKPEISLQCILNYLSSQGKLYFSPSLFSQRWASVAGEGRRKAAGAETTSNVPGLQTNQYFPSSRAVPLIFMSRRNSYITEAQKWEGKRRVGIVALELSPVFNMTPVRLIVKNTEKGSLQK